jgi:CHAD domain-containing protein
MITPHSYSESLSKSEKNLSDKVKAYLKEPSQDNVHDLRVSIRRLLTTASILPKKIRGQKQSQKRLESYERLFKLNAKVRDLDIVLSKLPPHEDDPAYAKVMKRLNKDRESSLKKAQRFASSIKDKKNRSVATDDLPGSAIQKRFKKTANSLSKSLRKHLSIVVKDPKNTAELHKLREDSRRLRFTLEMDDTPETSKLLPVLETWQEVLGKIRDSDIFIERLEHEKDSSKLREVLNQEKSNRNDNYERFLEIAKESPSFR